MSVYTKKGDKGKTTDFKGNQQDKDSALFEAIGDIDELNACLGTAKWISNGDYFWDRFTDIQRELFAINSSLAGEEVPLRSDAVSVFERQIDKLTNIMPKLSNFIYYAPTKLSAEVHLARAVARRAERSLVALSKVQAINPDFLVYMNRLSDYLFVVARWVAFRAGYRDLRWSAGKLRKSEWINSRSKKG